MEACKVAIVSKYVVSFFTDTQLRPNSAILSRNCQTMPVDSNRRMIYMSTITWKCMKAILEISSPLIYYPLCSNEDNWFSSLFMIPK